MSLARAIIRYTPEEYLRAEQEATEKHEYYHGEIFAMAGGSPQHARISASVARRIGNKLDGTDCGVFDSNLRVRIPRTTLYCYPDISVVCGPLQFDPLDVRKQTVLNPKLLVEVLSPGTESWDRGGKFENYQLIESLQEYVIVSSDSPRIEVYTRQPDGPWLYAATSGLEAVARLRSIGVDLAHAEVYAGAEFSEPRREAAPG